MASCYCASMMGAFRATRVVWRGPYSRMMDLGGVPPGKTRILQTKDAAKHCKLQLVAFDFDILTNSSAANERNTKLPIQEENVSNSPSFKPVSVMVDKVHEMASLLNVSLGNNSDKDIKNHHEDEIQDDLSALIGTHQPEREKNDMPLPSDEGPKMPFKTDVRAKYADKLKAHGGTGLKGVDHAKQTIADTIKKGDAAGHLAARAAAVSQTAAETKWMALTGTGSLLMYITNRSMKIALLSPKPSVQDNPKLSQQMKEFTKQLSLVSFDSLIEKGDNALDILKELQHEFNLDPVATMVVSDKDDYLKAAKDEGMISCRIRPKNAPRGNISAHYNVETVAQVQDVVDEINGISYTATRAIAGPR